MLTLSWVTKLLLLFLVIRGDHVGVAGQVACPPGWSAPSISTLITGSCYRASGPVNATWLAASTNSLCSLDGGHLAIFDTADEFQSINNSVGSTGTLSPSIHWVGGQRKNGILTWVSDIPMPSSNELAGIWKINEPSSGGPDDCVVSDVRMRGLLDARRYVTKSIKNQATKLSVQLQVLRRFEFEGSCLNFVLTSFHLTRPSDPRNFFLPSFLPSFLPLLLKLQRIGHISIHLRADGSANAARDRYDSKLG